MRPGIFEHSHEGSVIQAEEYLSTDFREVIERI